MPTTGRLPDFLLIGAMKSGSTTLYHHLREHPRLFLPAYKEPEFFVSGKGWERGVDWYSGLFADARSDQLVGEGSTSYTKPTEFPGVPERIRSVVPQVRLVYLLREPVARMRSMYAHMVLTGRERRPVDEALLTDETYLAPSRYADNIRRYLDVFPREQLHVMLTDDLQADPVAAVGGVTAFLGLADEPGFVVSRRTDLRTDDRRADRGVKSRLRGVAAVETGFQRLPAPVRGALRRVATRPTEPPPNRLHPETEGALRELLRGDLEDLRRLLGPGFTAWGHLDG